MKQIIPLLLLTLSYAMTMAQSVGINETGSNPDPSAMLDVQSSTRGMLVPRMNSVQRQNISNPATGLLVYDTNTDSFWWYDGGDWNNLIPGGGTVLSNRIADADNNTLVQVEESADEDLIRFDAAGLEVMTLDTLNLHLIGRKFLSSGSLDFSFTGPLPATGAGTRMMWVPQRSAFRAGTVNSTQWDISNLGQYSSVNGGADNIASGTYSFVGGGLRDTAAGFYSFVGGGFDNSTIASSSFIGGGCSNEILSTGAFVGGGLNNRNAGTDAFIGGGSRNDINASRSFVVGGQNDTITSAASYSGILGGQTNLISNQNSVISGGTGNEIRSLQSFIGGGRLHTIALGADDAFIGGGLSHFIEQDQAFIIGGQSDSVSIFGRYSGILGGERNSVDETRSVIAGGADNDLGSQNSFMGGGSANSIGLISSQSFIGGGSQNIVFSLGGQNFIGGGFDNQTSTIRAAVLGGESNRAFANNAVILGGANDTTSGPRTAVLGGQRNNASGNDAVIAGGTNNRASGNASFLGGGVINTATSIYTFVGGGTNNDATNFASGIVGGTGNTASGSNSFVGGSSFGTASGSLSSVIGGLSNNASGDYSFAGGGAYLSTPSLGETAFGLYPTTYTPSSSTNYSSSDRLFVIGNGSSLSNRSNALTMLKNGNTILGGDAPGSYKLKVVHNSFGFNIENFFSGDDWEFFVSSSSGTMFLYANGSSVGNFDASSGAYLATSDRKLKTNIRSMPSVLSGIMKLEPTTYQYKNDEAERPHLGFIAQEVEPFFPELVRKPQGEKGRDDVYTMDYSGFGVIAIKAIQEQQEMIEELKQEIEDLKKQVKD